jgi:hypothetical protein
MNIFATAFLVSFIFCIVKFIEMRFISKDPYPLKILVKESLFVFFSVIVGEFIIDQVKPMQFMESVSEGITNPEVFTDSPDF